MPESDNRSLTMQPAVNASIPVCLLGSTAAGKTCFLGGLAILSEPNRAGTIQVHAKGKAFERLAELADTLRRQEWPPPTNTLEIMEMTVIHNEKMIDLVMLDYPGGDFQKELGKLERDKIQDLYDHYSKSECLLLLLDPDIDVRAPVDADPEQLKQTIERQTAHLQAIRNAWISASGNSNSGTQLPKSPPDIGILLTKMDRVPELTTPTQGEAFLKTHAKELFAKISRLSAHLRVFPVTAVGSTQILTSNGKSRSVPCDDLRPSGYEPVFQWIIDRYRWRRRRPKVIRYSIVTTILVSILIGLAIWQWTIVQGHERILCDEHIPPFERLKATANMSGPLALLIPFDLSTRRELFQNEIVKIVDQINVAKSEQEFTEPLQLATELERLQPGSLFGRLKDAKKQAEDGRRNLIFKTVEDAWRTDSPIFKERAERFLGEYGVGQEAVQVRQWLEKHLTSQQEGDRVRVREIAIFNSITLQTKAEKINEYLAKWQRREDKDTQKQMRRAAELAIQFTQRQWYKVYLKRTGGVTTPFYHMVRVFIDDVRVKELWEPGETKLTNWDGAYFEFQWQSGQTSKVELINWGYFYNRDVGEVRDAGPVSIQLFRHASPIIPVPGWLPFAPNLFGDFEIQGISREDMKAFEDYVFPGNKW